MTMENKVTLILFSGDLDKVLAAFNIATGAAAMGFSVSIFFTFWGLNVVRKKREQGKPKDIIRKLLGLFNRGGTRRLKLSRLHMYGIGSLMMKKLMKKIKFPGVHELIRTAKELGVEFVACTTSMEMMGVAKDDLIEEVDRLAGVATYLSLAKESNINLFI
jgi:peroxiredoxin family protein